VQWGNEGEDKVAPLLNAGLNTMLILYGTEELTRDYMTIAATALGRPDRIGELVEWRDRMQKQIQARVADIPQDKRPRVLYLGRALTDLNASGSNGSYTNWAIELAGGKNAAEQLAGTVSINKEQIAAWNPDVILLNAFEADLEVNWVYNDPIVSLTNAARNRKVYKLPLGGYRWDPPSQESPLSWMWLANLLHPDVFSYDLRAEMKKDYRSLYGYELTEEDIDGILWIARQGDATAYEQFKVR